jgi:chromosome segregation ATPase
VPIIQRIEGLTESQIQQMIQEKIEPLVQSKFEIPKNEGLLKLIRERLGRLEDEVACARKDSDNNHEQLKRQLFNMKDDLENRKPEFLDLKQEVLDDQPGQNLLSEKVDRLDKEREVLEKQILFLIMKIDGKVDAIEGKCERSTNDQLALEEEVALLKDRVSESQQGIQREVYHLYR